MFSYLRDKLHTVRLKARYQKLIQERVLSLIEVSGPQPVSEDPGQWMLVGGSKAPLDETERSDARSRARQLVVENPHARNMLRLLEVYVVGPGLKLTHAPLEPSVTGPESEMERLLRTADRLWKEFLDRNRRHFSYREYAR